MEPMRIAIIGGGPAGLVTLKTVLEVSTPARPIEAQLFEAESAIGGTFRYRAYEGAELVSSKQLTTFSDFRLPASTPDHISLEAYVEYLQSYIDHFKLATHINLNCRVAKVTPLDGDEKKPNQKYEIHYNRQSPTNPSQSTPEVYKCSHLAITTGLHVTPNIPSIPGIEHFHGQTLHSSAYKSRSQLANHDILILGCGETAMDIAYDSIKTPSTRSVTMCFRTGFLSFPKVLNRFRVFGKAFGGSLPIDGLITNLFETAYVHHTVRASRLRSLISDSVIKKVMWFLTGTQEGCNQHVGALPADRLGRSYVFLNKSHKAMPYLNRPYKRPQPLLQWIGNEYMDPEEDVLSTRTVDTCTFPSGIDETGKVVFTEDGARKDWRRLHLETEAKLEVRPSLIVFCTGYRQDFGWLDPSLPRASEANVRNVTKVGVPEIAYIGFVRPGVGAIPPIAEQQAMWWLALILGNMREPTTAGHYKLLSRGNARIDYGVDYSTYMSVLGKDFGGAPGLLELWRECGWKALLVYCFGASFVSLYRLTGPFRCDAAREVAEGEILDTIMRRGWTGNFFFGVVPMVFYGMLNGLAYLMQMVGLLSEEREVWGVDGDV